MTAKWNSPSYPKPASSDMGDTWLDALYDGVDTARTLHAGSTDPSTSAPTAWGADDVGALWFDTTAPASPVLKVWQQLAASGPSYGWRTLRIPKVKWLTTPAAVTFSPTSPAAADVAFTDVSLATLLNSNQDAGQTEAAVGSVLMRLRCYTGASETIPTGSDNCYFAVRTKGGTNEQRLYPQVANRLVETTVWVPLDASEVFQFAIDVGGGTPSFTYEAEVLAILESL